MSELRRALDRRALVRAATWAVLVGLAIVILRTAWLSDDAFISFRTIRNVVSGDGLRWNLTERVQAFAHPLWILVLSACHAVTRDLIYTTYAVSLAMTLATAALLAFRVAATPVAGLTAVVVLASSRSFVDYATSGLENPLIHLLLVGTVLVLIPDAPWTPRRLFRLALLAALTALTRLDAILLVGPALVAVLWRVRTVRGLAAFAAGFAPLVAWEVFSIIYFGVPVPNTAYSKIPGAIPLAECMLRGIGYVRSCAAFDPLAMMAIAFGALVPLVRRQWALASLSAGIALYTLYVVSIGGDFMAGRFFTAPLVLAVACAARVVPLALKLPALLPAIAAIGLSLSLGDHSPLLAGSDYGRGSRLADNIDEREVADERGVYFKDTGLLRAGGLLAPPRHVWFDDGRRLAPGSVTRVTNVGFIGWTAPRDAVLFDEIALTDAFLARLPPIVRPTWRPGHLDRELPVGYLETRRTGQPHFRNRDLAEYYRQLTLVTSGPIWSAERWRAIWDLNTGALQPLLAHHGDVDCDLAELATPVADGATWLSHGFVLADHGVLRARLPAPRQGARLRIAADGDDHYDVALVREGREVWTGSVGPTPIHGLTNRELAIPPEVAFDQITVRGRGGDERYAVGYLQVD